MYCDKLRKNIIILRLLFNNIFFLVFNFYYNFRFVVFNLLNVLIRPVLIPYCPFILINFYNIAEKIVLHF